MARCVLLMGGFQTVEKTMHVVPGSSGENSLKYGSANEAIGMNG